MKTVVGVKTDKDLAEYLGQSRSGPAVWKLRGRIPVSDCIVLAEKHGVSLDWLILGRGSGNEEAEAEITSASMGPRDGYVEVPAFDVATFEHSEQSPVFWWSVPQEWMEREGLSTDDTIVVRAQGDSMAPTIMDSQVVVIDRRQRGEVDGVYLVRFGNTIRIKRVQYMVDGTIRLINDNRAYADDIVKNAGAFEVIGYCHGTFCRVR